MQWCAVVKFTITLALCADLLKDMKKEKNIDIHMYSYICLYILHKNKLQLFFVYVIYFLSLNFEVCCFSTCYVVKRNLVTFPCYFTIINIICWYLFIKTTAMTKMFPLLLNIETKLELEKKLVVS